MTKDKDTTFVAPERFTFDARDWPTWIQRFKRFRLLSSLNEKDEEYQINALVYTMGEKADEILSSFSLPDADAKKFEKVLEAFNNHFVGKRNIVYERARFGLRHQEEGETIENFVTDLHALSEDCDYKSLRESLVRDRIVLGVRDKKLSEKLMLTDNLDLAKAVDLAKQWEAVKRQQGDLQGNQRELDSVDKRHGQGQQLNGNSGQPMPSSSYSRPRKPIKSGVCKFCGNEHEFLKSKCPAVGKECSHCHEKDHYARCCPLSARPKPTGSADRVQLTEDTFMVDSIAQQNGNDETNRAKRWTTTVLMDNKPIEFQLDPGADVTSVPYYTFRKLWRERRIFTTIFKLAGPDDTVLQVCGTVRAKLSVNGHEIEEEIYIVKNLKRPLLGLRACEDLHLVKRLEEITKKENTEIRPYQEFPVISNCSRVLEN